MVDLLEYQIFKTRYLSLLLYEAFIVVAILVVAVILIWFNNRFFRHRIKGGRYHIEIAPKVRRIINLIIWLVACTAILQVVVISFERVLKYKLFSVKNNAITLGEFFIALLIYIFTRLILIVIQQVFDKKVKTKKIAVGTSASFFQISSYFLWVIAIALILETIGFDITIILAGSAALLVGLGLGIQQIFNDLVSGIILLLEHHLKVDDVVELNGIVGRVTNIGIRTSTILTLDNISIIVPNSKFTSDNIINWSHVEESIRFRVTIGVAYGSDVELVRSVLKVCAIQHPDIEKEPSPFVRFRDFADSALIFELFFWIKHPSTYETIRSDLRFTIDKNFRLNNIKIPFPQRDINVNMPMSDLMNSGSNVPPSNTDV